jgi:hypothetical protein
MTVLVESMDKIDKRKMSYFGQEGENKMANEIEEKKPEEMATVIPEEGKPMPDTMAEGAPVESPDAEKKEEEVEKKEEEKENEKYSFADYASNLIAYMEEEELKKDKDVDFSAVICGLYAKMCKMSAKMAQAQEEMSTLREFKAGIEAQQKQFAVEQTLRELDEKVIIPDDARAEMLADSEKYSISEIGIWKNNCKAKSFDFALKIKDDGEKKVEVKYALPFVTIPKQKSLWTKKN